MFRELSFFNCLGTTKLSRIFKRSVQIHAVLLKNFATQFEPRFAPNIQEVMKFYNLGDQSLDSDFSAYEIECTGNRY